VSVNEVDRRLELLEAPARLGISITEACRLAETSRTSFYEWEDRREVGGVDALAPRSRRPWTSPSRTDPLVEERVCALRDEHPKWGPVRIHGEMVLAGETPPAVITIKRILKRNGLIATYVPAAKPVVVRFERGSPNELWQTDATSVVLADGSVGWILNVLDDCARMLLACRAVATVDTNTAWTAMNAAIGRHGLPREVLSDNGSYFTGRLHDSVAVFERRLWARGIATTHSRPRHPQTCGKQERMHRTQKDWLDEHGPIDNIAELQAALDAFAEDYNQQRPHQAIGNIPPATRTAALEPAGPQAGLVQQREAQRRVDRVGKLSYSGWQIHIGSRHAGTTVDIIDDGAKIRVLANDAQLHAFSADEPKGYISTGQPRGHPRKLA
jgi:transposase InsO family protein